ncbi:hypothetical protein [Paenarthrobacter ureafaciens]|uniref:hypothetical protein n=1 Tax=Paenarthrobacter ureafaciens TaxID=37931 RepID=UPI0012EA4680
MPGARALLPLALRRFTIGAVGKVATCCAGDIEKVGINGNMVLLPPPDQVLVEVSHTLNIVNVSLMEKLPQKH